MNRKTFREHVWRISRDSYQLSDATAADLGRLDRLSYESGWAAWNMLGLSIIVFVLSELSPPVTVPSKGIGFHLGISSYFLLSLHVLSKAERSLALPARTVGIHSVT